MIAHGHPCFVEVLLNCPTFCAINATPCHYFCHSYDLMVRIVFSNTVFNAATRSLRIRHIIRSIIAVNKFCHKRQGVSVTITMLTSHESFVLAVPSLLRRCCRSVLKSQGKATGYNTKSPNCSHQ